MKEGWKVYKLDELLAIHNGKDHKSLEDGDIPVYGSGGIMRYVNKYLYDGESILLPRKGTLDNIMFTKGKIWTVDTMYHSSTNLELADSLYLCSYLQQLKLEQLDTGSALPSMTQTIYYSVKVTLPELPTQKRIASILSAYDDLIEVNNKRIELLEQSARELYKEWFVRMHFPNYKNTKFNRGIPEEWEVKKIDFFGQVITGKTPRTENKEYYYGNIPFIKTPDMHDNIFVQKTSMCISEKGATSQKKCTLPKYAICVSCIGTGGAVCITTAEKSQTNQQINSIILNNLVNLEFLFFAISNLKEIIEMVGATGSTMTNLSKGKFEQLKILYPKEELIVSYHDKVSPIFDQIENLQKQNQELTEIRNRLLPRLISGKLEVKA